MKKVAVLLFAILLTKSVFAQESINLSFDIIEQYKISIGEPINLSKPVSTHKMHLSFDGNFLRIDYSSGKNFLMTKVESWTIQYKYDKYTKKQTAKQYVLDIIDNGKHLYYIIDYSQLSSSVLKSIYIPAMSEGLVMSYRILQSDCYWDEKI